MNRETKIEILKARIGLLEGRNKENKTIVSKLKRKVRALEQA